MSEGNGGPRRAAERRVLAFVRRRFSDRAVCESLAGDASDRSFFRIRIPGLSPLVAMVHPEPFHLETLPWFVHARFLKEIGAPVPEIVGSYPSEGILLIQDLGDETLHQHLTAPVGAAAERAATGRYQFLYRQAVQLIAFLQRDGTRNVTPDLPAAVTSLDKDRLLFELRYFVEHYIDGMRRSPLTKDEGQRLDEWFVELAGTVAGYESVLCHRDYHSRNLMVRGDSLYMVDFQDARMGPYTYDLASLLRDAYIDLSEDLVEEMLSFFCEATGRATAGGPLPGRFREEFEMTCLQRNIKAVGTFAYQSQVKGNQRYVADIPRTLDHVRLNLMHRGFSDILELFQGPLLLS